MMALDKTFSSGEVLSAGDVNGYLLSMWTPIDKRVIASGAPVSSVSFQSIDSTFRMFRISYYAQLLSGFWRMRINNDTGSNYFWQNVSGINTTVSAVRGVSSNTVELHVGNTPNPNFGTIQIAKPTTTTTARIIWQETSNSVAEPMMQTGGGGWNNTSTLINRIDVYAEAGTFYGIVALEGVRGV
jgi:hypothetical protein